MIELLNYITSIPHMNNIKIKILAFTNNQQNKTLAFKYNLKKSCIKSIRLYRSLKRKIMKNIKKTMSFLFPFLEAYFGITYIQILDAFSFATILLVFFKLLYRIIYWGTSPIWYVNILTLILGVLFDLKYNVYIMLREAHVHYILKPLLGYNYYKHEFKERRDIEEKFSINYYAELSDDAWDEEIKNKYVFPPFKKEIQNNSIFIFWFQLSILLRLCIIKYPYLFIFCNFCFIYFLLFNKFFLSASIISLILLISRLNFFITDYTLQEFYTNIQYLESFDFSNFNLHTSWLNVKIISHWVVRSFYERELFYAIKKEKTDPLFKTQILPEISSLAYEISEYLSYKIINY